MLIVMSLSSLYVSDIVLMTSYPSVPDAACCCQEIKIISVVVAAVASLADC